MRQIRWKVHFAVLSLGVVAAFAPITLPGEAGAMAGTAECTSCCKESTSICVKCGDDECVTVRNAYDNGGGRCSVSPIAPEIPG